MPTLQIPDLAERAEAAGLDLAALGGLARLSRTELALLERGDPTPVSLTSARLLGELLGITTGASLLDGSGTFDDAQEPVGPAEPTRTRGGGDEDFPEDPTPPFERALNQVVDAEPGRYNDDDRELLAAALHHAEVPSTVGPAQLPGLAKEWLECARTFRGAREPVPGELLVTMAREGGRVASLMAKRAIERALASTRAAAAMAKIR